MFDEQNPIIIVLSPYSATSVSYPPKTDCRAALALMKHIAEHSYRPNDVSEVRE